MVKRICLLLSPIGLGAVALLILLAAASATPTRAAPPAAPRAALLQQTTTTPTYVVSDSLTGGVDYAWVEIRNSAAAIALGGDNWGSGEIPIGFYFPFYGEIYRNLHVSTNGYIYFGDDVDEADGALVPNVIGHSADPDNFIAPFGADLYVAPQVSRIYVARQGWRTIIEFVDVQWCCGLNDPHTFEIILYPDGRILTQYRQVRFLSNPTSYVVAGIENDDGSDGLEYYADWFEEDTLLNDGLAVHYDPGDSIFGHLILDVDDQYLWDDPGRTITGQATLVNLIGAADIFSVTYDLVVSSSVVNTESLWLVGAPDVVDFDPGTAIPPVPNTGEVSFEVTATIPLTAAWPDLARLQITVTSAASPTISNTVFITYGVAQRNLYVEKELYPDTPPAPGGNLRYLLSVTNDDYEDSGRGAVAREVQVTDSLPLSATWVSFDGPGVISGPISATGVFTWSLDLDAYDTQDLYIYMQVPTAVHTSTVLTNTAWTTMLGSVERGPFEDNTISHTLVVTEPRLVLDISKSGPDEIGAGQLLTYVVSLVNRGNISITDVIVTDTLPTGAIFHATTWPTWTWALSDTLVMTIGTMFNGADDWNDLSFQVGISVPATTSIGTLLTNTVQITTRAPLTGFVHAEGDSASATTEVIDARGDVWVAKYAETLGGVPVVPEPGRDYTFWLNYGSGGYVTVYTVTLTDVLPSPAHVTLLDAGAAGTASPDTSTSGQVVWTIPELAPDATGWAWVRVLIDEDTPTGTQLTNTARIADAAGLNITTTNDVSVVTITLRATDVTVRKWVTPTGTLRVGDWLTYTVRFSNTGVLSATGVRISDVLPGGLTGFTWFTGGHAIEALPGAPSLLVWRALAPLDTGDGGVITISAQLDPAYNWPHRPILTNRAEIHTSRGEEPVNDPNLALASNPVALASPYVLKTGPTLALPGELISYTIFYGNPGLLPAEGVRLTDTLPLSTTYVRDDALLGVPLSGTLGTHDWVAWDVGAIPSDTAGLSFTLVVSVSPDAPVGLPLRNTAVISSSSYDGNRLDNESTCSTPVGFDLSQSYKLVNGSAGTAVVAGAQVTYSVVLTNRGPYNAPSVLLQDPIPDNTAYVPGSLAGPGSDYGYDLAGDLITWTGVVSGNSAVNVTFQVTVADAGPLPRGTMIYNTALISDGVQTFQASVPLTVSGPDLDNSYKTVDNPWPVQGERITYTIVLVNDGEVDASASLTDALPLDVLYTDDGQASSGVLQVLTPISWTGTISMGELVVIGWTGTISVGQRVTITLPVTVVAAPGSEFVNTAQVDDGVGVVILRSVVASTATPELDLPATRKEVSSSDVASGERVTYTITLYNGGDGPTPWAWMQDVIQGGYYGGGGGASSGALDASNAPTITWNGALASGESVVINIPVVITATEGLDVLNVAQISDGYNAPLTRSASVHVYRLPDISGSNKTVDPGQARVGETVDYLLTVNNSGETPTAFSVSDTLDSDTAFEGFMGTPPGSFGYAAGVITWTGTVNGGAQAQLAFQATISPSASGQVVNTARFADGAGSVYTRTASTLIVAAELVAAKQATPGGAVVAGATLTYSIVMQNVGGDAAQVHLSDTLPLHTIYEVDSAQSDGSTIPPIYHPSTQTLCWDGDLVAGQAITITFRALVEPGTLSGSSIANVAWLQELSEPGPLFSVATTNTVLAPAFSAVKWSTPPDGLHAGEVLNYGILLTNAQQGVARVVVTDAIPLNSTYISASAQVQSSDLPLALLESLGPLAGVYDAPRYDAVNERLTWSGDILARTAVTLTFAVTVNHGVSVGTVITNTAWVDELSDPEPAMAYQAFNLVTGYKIYLPLVVRQN